MSLRKSQKSQSKPTEYPSGIFIKTERGYFYVHSSTRRLRIITKRLLDSWNPQHVLEVSEEDPAVKKLVISASRLKFRNGSLLYSQADGKMYLVSDNKLRHIVNPDVLEHLGRKRSEAVWVSREEIEIHQMGEELA